MKKYWLVKSEPNAWSWDDQVREGVSMWDGVRNYQARNNMINMKKGDLCFFYHSVYEKSIIGILKIAREFYPDPTDESGKFVVVDVEPLKKLKKPVLLKDIKNNIKLKNIALVKQSRLSVMQLKKFEWDTIIKLSE
tara:strand:- start:7271 stop:7678 length:408 start_codon:yes stop_codon:yes gene_type:complete